MKEVFSPGGRDFLANVWRGAIIWFIPSAAGTFGIFGIFLAEELFVFLVAAVSFVAVFDELPFTGSTTSGKLTWDLFFACWTSPTTFKINESSSEDGAEDELEPSSSIER
jgi:hypothetical protein